MDAHSFDPASTLSAASRDVISALVVAFSVLPIPCPVPPQLLTARVIQQEAPFVLVREACLSVWQLQLQNLSEAPQLAPAWRSGNAHHPQMRFDERAQHDFPLASRSCHSF